MSPNPHRVASPTRLVRSARWEPVHEPAEWRRHWVCLQNRHQAAIDRGAVHPARWSSAREASPSPPTARIQASAPLPPPWFTARSEEHTSELQSLMRISYAVFCFKNKKLQAFHYNTQRYQVTEQTNNIKDSIQHKQRTNQ